MISFPLSTAKEYRNDKEWIKNIIFKLNRIIK